MTTATMEQNKNETKDCHMCGESILAVAKKCKHCGSALTEATMDSSDRNANSGDKGNDVNSRKLSTLLAIGILILPFVFSWFTLRKGYSKDTRIGAFAWWFAYAGISGWQQGAERDKECMDWGKASACGGALANEIVSELPKQEEKLGDQRYITTQQIKDSVKKHENYAGREVVSATIGTIYGFDHTLGIISRTMIDDEGYPHADIALGGISYSDKPVPYMGEVQISGRTNEERERFVTFLQMIVVAQEKFAETEGFEKTVTIKNKPIFRGDLPFTELRSLPWLTAKASAGKVEICFTFLDTKAMQQMKKFAMLVTVPVSDLKSVPKRYNCGDKYAWRALAHTISNMVENEINIAYEKEVLAYREHRKSVMKKAVAAL